MKLECRGKSAEVNGAGCSYSIFLGSLFNLLIMKWCQRQNNLHTFFDTHSFFTLLSEICRPFFIRVVNTGLWFWSDSLGQITCSGALPEATLQVWESFSVKLNDGSFLEPSTAALAGTPYTAFVARFTRRNNQTPYDSLFFFTLLLQVQYT